MGTLKPKLPKISDQDRTPLVDVLLELLAWQQIQIDKLEQEILKLKGETTKPNIKPSKMDGYCTEDGDVNDEGSLVGHMLFVPNILMLGLGNSFG